MTRDPSPKRPLHQQGFALVITLVFLTVMTLIGLSAAQNSALSEKITSNFQLKDRALRIATRGAAVVAECARTTPSLVTGCNSLSDPFGDWQLTSPPAVSSPVVTFEVTGNARDPSGAVLASASITFAMSNGALTPRPFLRLQQSN